MSLDKGSVGKTNFIEEHGLWSEDMKRQSLELIKQVKKEDLQTIRVAWGDQHGIVRGKNVMARDFIQSLDNGIDFQTATLFFDTTNNMFAPMFEPDAGIGMPELAGGPDAILVPDPSTFKILPWAHKTGWISGVRHDSGIVYVGNNEKYILVLLSKNLEDDIEGADFLAKISLEIYNFLS